MRRKKYLKGGRAKRLPGGATEFIGRTHEEGGIILDPMTEVEHGETMDKVQGQDYFFSSYLKLGGRSFADRHKQLLAAGAKQKDIDELAAIQEKIAGRDQYNLGGERRKFQTGGHPYYTTNNTDPTGETEPPGGLKFMFIDPQNPENNMTWDNREDMVLHQQERVESGAADVLTIPEGKHDSNLVQSTTADEVYNYIKTTYPDLSENQILGIVANVQAESGFNPSALGDGDTSGGLFQHHGPRFDAMKEFVGEDWETNWKKQIDFAMTEPDMTNYLSTDYDTPTAAVAGFMRKFERPADQSDENVLRRADALGTYDFDGDGTFTEVDEGYVSDHGLFDDVTRDDIAPYIEEAKVLTGINDFNPTNPQHVAKLQQALLERNPDLDPTYFSGRETDILEGDLGTHKAGVDSKFGIDTLTALKESSELREEEGGGDPPGGDPPSGDDPCPDPTMKWDPVTETCVPINIETGDECDCPDGQKGVVNADGGCDCPDPIEGDDKTDVKEDPCTGGQIWDEATQTCVCPEGTMFNAETQTCETPVDDSDVDLGPKKPDDPCGPGMVWSESKAKCVKIKSGKFPWLGVGTGLIGLGQLAPAIMAMREKPDYMSEPGRLSTIHLDRKRFNDARAANAADYRGMGRFLETSGMGPGAISARMAAWGKKQAGDAKIGAEEARINAEIQGQEARLNLDADKQNIANRMKVDEFNRGADAATRDRRLEGVQSVMTGLAGMMGDYRMYKAEERKAEAIEGPTGVLDREHMQNLYERTTGDPAYTPDGEVSPGYKEWYSYVTSGNKRFGGSRSYLTGGRPMKPRRIYKRAGGPRKIIKM
jgi:hypothetical protein